METRFKIVLSIFVFICLSVNCISVDPIFDSLKPRVSISEGILEGTYGINILGAPIYKFLGIPYGEAPIGDLRFKAPQPVKSWTGIKNATTDGDACYNRDIIDENTFAISGGENCLVLNVYTKQINTKNKISKRHLKPVMVYIHGGAFIMGSNKETIWNPAFLLAEDIVVVVINYRLGLLGFLSLEDKLLEVPGNAGLKDQVLALKWVKRNIQKFGGNPNDVTIFGESAGASSVHYHILSPAAKGLFHKAILQSGVSLSPWSLGKSNGQIVAEALGVSNASEKQVLDILRNMTGYDIFLLQETIFDHLVYGSIRPFVPVIEKNSSDAIITKEPFTVITSGEYNHVPLLIGYNSNEGIVMDILKNLQPPIYNNYNYTLAIPWYMNADQSQSQNISDLMNQFYLQFDDQLVKEKLWMDSNLLGPIVTSIKHHFRTSNQLPIYVYRVSVNTSRNFLKVTKNLTQIKGTSHGDELGFLWDIETLPKLELRTLESLTVFRFVKLWTNFAKYGNPTPTYDLGVIFPPINNEDFLLQLDIGKELKILSDIPERDRINVWKKIYQQSSTTANFLT